MSSKFLSFLIGAAAILGFHSAMAEDAKTDAATAKANAEEVCRFMKEAKMYFIATVDGDQPRVRPFGTAHVFEGKLYIQTGKKKDVSKQIAKNGKVELCAFRNGEWLRLSGTLVNDDRREAKAAMLEAHPELKAIYSPDDGNTQVLYFKDATARFCSFTKPERKVHF